MTNAPRFFAVRAACRTGRRDFQLQDQDVAGLDGGESRFDVGGGKPGVCARTHDDLVFALVIDRDDRRSGGGGAADPNVAGIDPCLIETSNPSAMGVVADGAGEARRYR